jgi:hypothetical protein
MSLLGCKGAGADILPFKALCVHLTGVYVKLSLSGFECLAGNLCSFRSRPCLTKYMEMRGNWRSLSCIIKAIEQDSNHLAA